MKRLPKKLVWTTGIVVGVILVTVIGLRLFFPAERVKDMAVAMASEKLGRQVSVEEARLSLAGGLGVKLEDVVIANPAGFAGDPFFVADNVDLKLRLRPLFRGDFQVQRLVVDRPVMRLHRQTDGTDNFTFGPPLDGGHPDGGSGKETGGQPAAVAVSFDRLEIHEGTLSFQDDNTGQGIRLEGLKLAGGLTNPAAGKFRSTGSLAVDSLLVTGDQPLPSVAAEIDYELTHDLTAGLTELTRGDLRFEGFSLTLTGSLAALGEEWKAAGKIRASDLALADLMALVPPEQSAQLESFVVNGVVGLEADLDFDSSRLEPLGYEGILTVADFLASGSEVDGELKVDRVTLGFKPDELVVGTQGGEFSGQPLEVAVKVVDFEAPRVDGRVAGDLDLAFVAPFLPPEKKAVLSGHCRLESTFSGAVDNFEDLDYAGTAVFSDVYYADSALPDTLQRLNGSVVFDPETVTVKSMEALFGAGDLSLTGTLTRHLPYFLPAEKDNRENLPKPEFTFAARSRRIDIDKLYPPASPAAEAVPGSAPVTMPDTMTLEAIPDIVATGTFAADTLIYSEVPFTGVKGKARLRDRVLECYEVTARVYGGTAGGKVTVDLNDLASPAYSGNFTAADIEADNFVSRFTGITGVLFGKTGMSGSFRARGRDPEMIRNTLSMDSAADLVSGRVVAGEFVTSALGSLAEKTGRKLEKEQTLKDLSTLVKVENGRVGLDQFQTRLGNFGDLSLGGSYGFNGDLEYAGSLLLSKEETARLYAGGGLAGSVAQLFGDKAERLRLPLSVGGTMKKPRLNIDYTELTNNLQSQAQDSLKDEVENKLKGLLGK